MSDASGPPGVIVAVKAEPGGRDDQEELDRLAGQLRTELLSLPVDRVERAPIGEPKPGGKGLDLVAAGSIIVKAAPHVVRSVVNVLRAWQGRHPGRTLEVEVGGQKLKLTSASKDEAETIIAAWVDHLNAGRPQKA
jgi:hypothetical protein